MFNRGTILSGRTREVHMDSIERELMQRRQTLEKAIEMAQKAIEAAPEGTLQVDGSKSIPRYFHIKKDPPSKEYITKKNSIIAELLANKEYADKLLPKAKKELDEIDRYLEFLDHDRADSVYAKLKSGRKSIVSPILLDEETSRQLWNAQRYEQSLKYPEHLKFSTRRGDLVRSKSEALIANIYFEFGIPYRYECALTLKDNVVCYPDFTLLDTAHRRIMYHEHLGRLDNPDYLAEQMWKYRMYQKNGIYTGKNLIITGETNDHPFDSELFRSNVREIFLI